MHLSQENKPLENNRGASISLTALPVWTEADTHSIQRLSSTPQDNEDQDDTEHHLTGINLYLVVAGLSMSVLLVALVGRIPYRVPTRLLNPQIGPSDTGNGSPTTPTPE